MKYEKLNKEIISLLGGNENVKSVAHCVTRLRLTLHDVSRAETEAIKELDGVIDVVSNDVAYQIIIGTHVVDVYNEFIEMIKLKDISMADETRRTGLNGIVKSALVVISETMTSIVEVLLAAGILAGIMAVFTLLGLWSEESSTYMIFDTLRNAVFHFLPVFIATSAAKRLQVNPYVAMVLALTLLSSNIDGAEGLSLFGYNLPQIGYANTFIPILLGVWFLGIVTKVLDKVIPKGVQYFLVPVLSLVLTLPVVLIVFGPLGTWIGEGLNIAVTFLMNTVGNWLVVALYAALQPFLIVLGAANFTYPITLNSLAQLGYDPIISHAATISDIAVAGATLGYFLRTRKTKEKQIFGSVSFSALMGVTEPAIFGVFLKYRRPFIAVIVGGGIGGTIAGLAGVKTMGMVWGLAALPTYLAYSMDNFVWMLISVVTSFVISVLVAYGIGIPDDAKEQKKAVTAKGATSPLHEVMIGTVAKGVVVPLEEVADQAFASGALGKGVGIIPIETETSIYVPVSGTMSVVFPSLHAYGIKTAEGIELLIHIGIDTVNLNGQYFTSFVEQGQEVSAGDVLASFTVDKVKEAGFDPTIIVVVTNSGDYLDVIATKDETDPNLLTVIL